MESILAFISGRFESFTITGGSYITASSTVSVSFTQVKLLTVVISMVIYEVLELPYESISTTSSLFLPTFASSMSLKINLSFSESKLMKFFFRMPLTTTVTASRLGSSYFGS